MKTYPHYTHLPRALRYNLNVIRWWCYEASQQHSIFDENGGEIFNYDVLSLKGLLTWMNVTLPDTQGFSSLT